MKPFISLQDISFLSRATDTPLPAISRSHATPRGKKYSQTEYRDWLNDLCPRTCLLVQWLSSMGVMEDPGPKVRAKARRFSEKSTLLGRIVDNRGGETVQKTSTLLSKGDFEIYVAWLMYLRFCEYVPPRFVQPGGREKVLHWVKTQLRRPELTSDEALRELLWHSERLSTELGENDSARWVYHGMN